MDLIEGPGSPVPMYLAAMLCRGLEFDIFSYDEKVQPIVNDLGEMGVGHV